MRITRAPHATRAISDGPRLLADIGGTNARFGWQSDASKPIEKVRVMPCAEHPQLLDAIQAYIALADVPPPKCAAIGIANPVMGDRIQMTNHHWQFSMEATRAALDLHTLLVLNDFTALALAIPALPRACLHAIGPCEVGATGPMALLGPGTGLGVSGLIPVPGTAQWAPIVGEGGHVSLAASNADEFAVLQELRHQYGHVSAERVLCGQGLVDLHQSLSRLHNHLLNKDLTPAQVLEEGLHQPGSVSRQVLELFCGWLGSVAGDLALTLGAQGGLYIGGGIAPRMREYLMASSFRQRFEAKGRFQSYLQNIPTWLIDAPEPPALLGASMALSMPGFE